MLSLHYGGQNMSLDAGLWISQEGTDPGKLVAENMSAHTLSFISMANLWSRSPEITPKPGSPVRQYLMLATTSSKPCFFTCFGFQYRGRICVVVVFLKGLTSNTTKVSQMSKLLHPPLTHMGSQRECAKNYHLKWQWLK
ncbi:hypothetical protein KIL84_009653 [Mauremys mutica]|uniref:Uncharacterized protein n=1 Tax=Mauremys mutica TaxID=74926 RepID=A0A9D3XI73_9SAUR|nr:hypothetical protein KIL84_009653 [Mauremys mutica]